MVVALGAGDREVTGGLAVLSRRQRDAHSGSRMGGAIQQPGDAPGPVCNSRPSCPHVVLACASWSSDVQHCPAAPAGIAATSLLAAASRTGGKRRPHHGCHPAVEAGHSRSHTPVSALTGNHPAPPPPPQVSTAASTWGSHGKPLGQPFCPKLSGRGCPAHGSSIKASPAKNEGRWWEIADFSPDTPIIGSKIVTLKDF